MALVMGFLSKKKNEGGNDYAKRRWNRTKRTGAGYRSRNGRRQGRTRQARWFGGWPGRQLRLPQMWGKSAASNGIALLWAAVSQVWGRDDARINPAMLQNITCPTRRVVIGDKNFPRSWAWITGWSYPSSWSGAYCSSAGLKRKGY